MLRYAMLCYAMLRYAMLCYAMLRYAMLCYAMLCQDPSKRLTPTIYHAKHMLRRLKEDRDVVLFCDLHGHSRKHNIFCYGCGPTPDNRLAERIFPRLLARNSTVFSYRDCSFKVQRSKESTARVVGFKEHGIA